MICGNSAAAMREGGSIHHEGGIVVQYRRVRKILTVNDVDLDRGWVYEVARVTGVLPAVLGTGLLDDLDRKMTQSVLIALKRPRGSDTLRHLLTRELTVVAALFVMTLTPPRVEV